MFTIQNSLNDSLSTCISESKLCYPNIRFWGLMQNYLSFLEMYSLLGDILESTHIKCKFRTACKYQKRPLFRAHQHNFAGIEMVN